MQHFSKGQFVMMFAVLMFSSGLRAQPYKWHLTHDGNGPGTTYYSFDYLDCVANVCTAAGSIVDTSNNFASDRIKLMFFRSTDGGESWTDQDPHLPPFEENLSNWWSKVQQIDSLNAVGIADSGMVVRTFDGGSTWQVQDVHSKGQVADVHFSDDSTGIVIVYGSPLGQVEITHDGGRTWIAISFYPFLGTQTCHSDGGSKFRVIGYDNGTIYSTTDDWVTFDSTLSVYNWKTDPRVIWNSNFRGSDTIVSLVAHWGDSSQWPTASLIRTTDGGIAWDSIPLPDLKYPLLEDGDCLMSPLDSSTVLYGIYGDDDIFLSLDHGMTWQSFPMIFDTVYHPQQIGSIAITTGGHPVAVFPGPINQPGQIGRGELLNKVASNQDSDSRMSIFPNPTSSSITITFFEAESTVQLLDILGREVLCGTVPESGSLTLDASSLPAGLYYISDGNTRAKFVKK
jgi:photosystem II stability/assembly factor-like uncharacterized protein